MKKILIIGLGNPGDKYIDTRHNLGFMVVDKYVVSSKYHAVWKESKKFKAWIIKHEDLIFTKPTTYMNNSGLAVQSLATYYQIPTTDIIVVHDELDLPLGKIKVRVGGSGAGHHGVESIISSLDSDKFSRVRLGIGNLKTKGAEHKRVTVNTDRFVTEEFRSDEKSKVKHMLKQAVEALDILIHEGLEKAQNQYN